MITEVDDETHNTPDLIITKQDSMASLDSQCNIQKSVDGVR